MISSLRSGLLRWHASSSVAFLGQGYRLLSWLMLSQNYSLSLSSCRARMSWMCAFIFLSCLFGVKPSQTDLALVSRVKNKGDTNEGNDCRHGKRPSFFKRRGRRGERTPPPLPLLFRAMFLWCVSSLESESYLFSFFTRLKLASLACESLSP